jgi:glycerophosphoryl diester phosphodiesterase
MKRIRDWSRGLEAQDRDRGLEPGDGGSRFPPEPRAPSSEPPARQPPVKLSPDVPSFAFFQGPRPQVFAHRGGSALAPENTLAAFDRAVAMGIDGLELDVHLSSDGVVVVHHDRLLTRTTNLSGAVEQHTAQELSRADAGWHFGGDSDRPFRGRGIGVPTLAAVLERYREVRVIIELKVNDAALARAVIDVVTAQQAVDRVCLGSFGLRVLRAARRLAPHIATSGAREEVRWALYRSWLRWPVSRVAYGGYQIPEISGSTRVVSPRFVADARAAGLAVQVWTVDDEVAARRLLGWGVDALITDRPDVILAMLKERSAPAPAFK